MEQKDKGRKELLWPPVNPNDVQQDVMDKESPNKEREEGRKDRRIVSRAALTNSAYAQHVRTRAAPRTT